MHHVGRSTPGIWSASSLFSRNIIEFSRLIWYNVDIGMTLSMKVNKEGRVSDDDS